MPAKVPGVAGPAAFQGRLVEGLGRQGWIVSYGFSNLDCDVFLVIGGSREFGKLHEIRDARIPIVQRLNGMNWIHRRAKTGLRHFLRAELNNFILRYIRNRLVDWIVYQSEFARMWWENRYGVARAGKSVILNGVPLNDYSPRAEGDRSSNRLKLLMVEGNISGGYEVGLRTGVLLARKISTRTNLQVQLSVVGNVPQELKNEFNHVGEVEIEWVGLLPPGEVLHYFHSADLFFAGDPNPACPNAVIEALACGLPVVAFKTGALPEIVVGNSGRIVPYGGNVWKLDPPDIHGLVEAAMEVLANLSIFREGARNRAVETFSAEDMVEKYIAVFDQARE